MKPSDKNIGHMDIVVDVTQDELKICKECDTSWSNTKSLGAHLQSHGIKFEDYLVKYFMNGQRHLCPICQNPTRYVKGKLAFRKYCIEHQNEARKEWSKNNMSFDPGWKKGLTKHDHSGIASQAKKMTGENNPWHGGIREDIVEKARTALRITEKEFVNLISTNSDIKCKSTYNIFKNKNQHLTFKCLICESIFSRTLANFEDNDKCPSCYPAGWAMIGRTPSNDTIQKIIDKNKLSEEEYEYRKSLSAPEIEVLTPYPEYKNNDHQKLEIKCKNCNNVGYKTLVSITRKSRCYTCYPFHSIGEQEIRDFLKSYDIEINSNVRGLLENKAYEIDVHIPEKNFAIEFNGLYWHCEREKEKNYHQMKTDLCKQKDINLFHIFEDEWREKKDILKSMILYRLDLCKERIFARKCNTVEVSKEQANEFFTKTHISGKSNLQKAFGLMYNGRLVSCISFMKPKDKNKYLNTIEIKRFSSDLNTSIVGGFEKLLFHSIKWAKEEGFKSIMSYSDLRFGEGRVYLKSGFELVGKTDVMYWYVSTKDYETREFRFKYRARNGKSEKEVAEENNVCKIYGTRNNIYLKNI